MAIDFRNPLASHGSLLTRLRNMIDRAGPAEESVIARDKAPGAEHGERVTLSEDARRIAGETSADISHPPQAADRIASLKHAIESGAFRIDAARIADKVRLQYGSR